MRTGSSSMDNDDDDDPFPMRSKEAIALISSTNNTSSPTMDSGGNGGGGMMTSWNRMNTTTTTTTATIRRSMTAPAASGSYSSPLRHSTSSKRSSTASSTAAAATAAGYSVDLDHDNDDDDNDDEDNMNKNEEDYYDSYDEFLDEPMHTGRYSRTKPFSIFCYAFDHSSIKLRRVIIKIMKRLYGNNVSIEEMYRVFVLSTTLFFMIGGYWLLRSLKDAVLTALCGVDVIPKAKMISVLVVLGVVSIYNSLLGRKDIPKYKLFYLFGTFYFVLFCSIAFLLNDPIIGLPNQVSNPYRLLGWISYCSIESFGSVMVSLFWSFANSVISLESAKASYGLMVATAQVGSILGPTIVNAKAESWGLSNCYFCGAFCMLALQICMKIYISIYGTGEDEATMTTTKSKKKKDKAGVLEGLVLFWKFDYIKGIFAISCLFMVEVTIVDYTMKVLAKEHFSTLHPCTPGNTCWDVETNQPLGLSSDATAAFTTFMGLFGQATNTLSFLMSLLGTSAIIRTLGLRTTLLLFPSLCLIIIIMVRFSPTLWIVFAAMMMLKACSYALNNPTKEILYQPTSNAVKFKAKSWIDIFGARGSKALGSVVTNAFSDSAENLVSNGSLVGMAVASFLIVNARFMGKKFDEYVKTGYIVGGEEEMEEMMMQEEEEEEDEDGELLELAIHQNDAAANDDDDDGAAAGGGTTSCAIYDDGDVGALEEGQSQEDEEVENVGGGNTNTGTSAPKVVQI